MRLLLLSLLSASATIAMSKSCATLSGTVTANTMDPTPIFTGGGAYNSPHNALFMSASFAYSVDTSKMSVQQAPMGSFQAQTGVVGIYDQTPLLLHVIPTGTSVLHFLTIKNGRLVDYWSPMSLAGVLPRGFVPTAAAISKDPNLGMVDDIVFASADIVVRICHNPFYPNMLGSYGVFNLSRHFDNPLGVDVATHVGIDENTERLFVSRKRSGSGREDAADVVVLQLDPSCGVVQDNRVYVQPQPVSLSVLEAMNNAGAFLYWPMAPDAASGPGGRLYRWDLQAPTVANVSLGLALGDEIAPVGFAETLVQMSFYGVVVSQTPGASDVVATLIDGGDPFHVNVFDVVCKSKLTMGLPTAYAPVAHSDVVFASAGGVFSLVHVPDPRSSVPERETQLNATSLLPTQCSSFSFGLPNTCAGCVPPSALCGMTEHCTSGCCFVSGGRVMCCKQSPPGTAMPGFSCA